MMVDFFFDEDSGDVTFCYNEMGILSVKGPHQIIQV